MNRDRVVFHEFRSCEYRRAKTKHHRRFSFAAHCYNFVTLRIDFYDDIRRARYLKLNRFLHRMPFRIRARIACVENCGLFHSRKTIPDSDISPKKD